MEGETTEKSPQRLPSPEESKKAEESSSVKISMGPPPPKIANSVPKFSDISTDQREPSEESPKKEESLAGKKEFAPPYAIPPWSGPPGNPFYFEVLKDGSIVGQLDVSEKGAYMFGRVDLCDFVLEHPTISRFHAVLQYRKDREAFIYDLGSTHGTFVNKHQIEKKAYTEVHVGDIIRFGQSSRLYIFQGPSDLMPPEGDLRKLRNARVREEIQDREASLLRAKVQASMEDGISWGMGEDAIEDTSENDAEEVTWQNFKGQLTERQEKTRNKIIKRMEKVSNMRKEIDSIRVKDISQGGLTQGQQTQIARNEQRMGQILEELDSLEETLNDSIRESIGARAKTSHSKKKGVSQDDDEDEIPSDEDEFYDRTKKRQPKKLPEQKVVETAETLLDKKDALVKQIEEKTRLLQEEKSRKTSDAKEPPEDGDELDAYMTGLSSQLVLDTTTRIQGEISALQSELDRIIYLLKIADPGGESAKKRECKKLETIPVISKVPDKPQKISAPKKPDAKSITPPANDMKPEPEIQKESKPVVFAVPKPQWLGAVKEGTSKPDEGQKGTASGAEEKPDEFIDYKDRKLLVDGEGLEQAGAGLIIRKRKQEKKQEEVSAESALEVESAVADAVALLLKHKKGYVLPEDEVEGGDESGKKKTKRVLGPERPPFLEKSPDYEAWMPPKGQSGDGRTSLNDRLGY